MMVVQTPQVALVTGARTGIGRACAIALAQDGFQVYGTSRQSDVDATDLGFAMLRMDVNDKASVEAGVQRILDEQQRLDVVVNNAAWSHVNGAVEDTSIDEAKSVFETNFFGVLRVCHAVLPVMRSQRRGLIINVSSIGGQIGLPFQGIYSATKFAIEGMTEALRMELKPFGVDVVLLEPGDTSTETLDKRLQTVGSGTSNIYRAQYVTALARIEADERNGQSTDRVARVVVAIARRRRRRVRYIAGRFYEKLAIAAHALLPGTLFERIIMMNYGL